MMLLVGRSKQVINRHQFNYMNYASSSENYFDDEHIILCIHMYIMHSNVYRWWKMVCIHK